MTSGCLLLYCGRSVWVQILYDTYACRRRHCVSERHASYLLAIIASWGDYARHERCEPWVVFAALGMCYRGLQALTDMLSPCLTGSRTVISKWDCTAAFATCCCRDETQGQNAAHTSPLPTSSTLPVGNSASYEQRMYVLADMTGRVKTFGQDGKIPLRPSRPTRMGVVAHREWLHLSY